MTLRLVSISLGFAGERSAEAFSKIHTKRGVWNYGLANKRTKLSNTEKERFTILVLVSRPANIQEGAAT